MKLEEVNTRTKEAVDFLVAALESPEPQTPDQLDAPPYLGSALASSTAGAPSLS
jgi:hypothetical protein